MNHSYLRICFWTGLFLLPHFSSLFCFFFSVSGVPKKKKSLTKIWHWHETLGWSYLLAGYRIVTNQSEIELKTVASVFVEMVNFPLYFWGGKLQWSKLKAGGMHMPPSPWHALCNFCLLSPLKWLQSQPLSRIPSWLLSLLIVIYKSPNASSRDRIWGSFLCASRLSGMLGLHVKWLSHSLKQNIWTACIQSFWLFSGRMLVWYKPARL